MLLIQQKYKKKDPINFIKDIKKYIIDSRYIKINNKKVIGIFEPFLIPNISQFISIWRNKSIEYEIGEIYILICQNHYKWKKTLKLKNVVDGSYDFPPRNNLNIKNKKKSYMLYSNLIYKWINFPHMSNDFPLFGGTMLEWDNTPRRKNQGIIFKGYSPEKFYLLNKIIIKWTRVNYNITNRFIFINAWNEWGEGTYLEPDDKYGYSSINALSKALFNLTYINNYNISSLSKFSQIAVQVHVFYIDLIKTIINKTNNIPVKFDLFITVTCLKHLYFIKNNFKNLSNANKFEIISVKNKGRDVYPFLTQLKLIFKNYKYICHIHTKKTLFNSFQNFGNLWRNYLFNNLLGSQNIVSEILTYFENNKNLGFIFPETYQGVFLLYGNILNYKDKLMMNNILKILFPKKQYEIGKFIDFPEGNMFWAKIKSIHQIFNLANEDYFPKEKGQIDGEIMHGIERIWLYIVKLNGYYYKKIFKHY